MEDSLELGLELDLLLGVILRSWLLKELVEARHMLH